jgi:hypothetical protein
MNPRNAFNLTLGSKLYTDSVPDLADSCFGFNASRRYVRLCVTGLGNGCGARTTPFHLRASYNMDMRRFSLLLLGCLASRAWCADGPAFDLAGPKVDVHVKRGEVTLPIGETPNLLPGDRIWIHPDFPDSQSEHYVLIVAFLRGSTNPPPQDWFTRVETWSRRVREEGVFVTVPQEAQQAVVFLAPETGGDFSTLRKAVHDRPGAFVRATRICKLPVGSGCVWMLT